MRNKRHMTRGECQKRPERQELDQTAISEDIEYRSLTSFFIRDCSLSLMNVIASTYLCLGKSICVHKCISVVKNYFVENSYTCSFTCVVSEPTFISLSVEDEMRKFARELISAPPFVGLFGIV